MHLGCDQCFRRRKRAPSAVPRGFWATMRCVSGSVRWPCENLGASTICSWKTPAGFLGYHFMASTARCYLFRVYAGAIEYLFSSLSMQWLLLSVVSVVYFTQLACSLCRRRKLCAGAGNRGLSLQGRPEIAASASPRCDMVRSGFRFLCFAPVSLDLTCGLTNLSWVHRA